MNYYTTSRLPLPKVKRLARNLPGILCGRLPDTDGLRQVFIGAFAHELYRLGYNSFRVRSIGSSIAGFTAWRPLSKATIKRKSGKKTISTLYDKPESINVRTGRLLASFAPGTASAAGYVPVNSDQRVKVRKNSVELTQLVKYAMRALGIRPVWPDDMKDLIEQATRKGIDALAARLQQVMNVR
jgi:hypothetical protein